MFRRSLEYQPKSTNSRVAKSNTPSEKEADDFKFGTESEKAKKQTFWIPIAAGTFAVILAPIFALLELAFALLVVASIFAAPISLGMIANGQRGWKVWLVAVVSTTVVLLRYLILPILNRMKLWKRFKKRFLRV